MGLNINFGDEHEHAILGTCFYVNQRIRMLHCLKKVMIAIHKIVLLDRTPQNPFFLNFSFNMVTIL